MSKSKRPLNRVLSIKDYQKDADSRKAWEVDMAMTTLKSVIDKDAEILGVGAGIEPTIFLLSNKVRRVFATDMYADPGVWSGTAPMAMLTGEYEQFAGGQAFNRQRIIVQHMDGRRLNYPDDTFDGIFSSGSIEHFGSWSDIATAAREIGRVLKPGGVASISTEFKLDGEGEGWEGIRLFTPELIEEHIIKPSGLKLIDEPDWTTDQETLDTAWDLREIVLHGKTPVIEGVLREHGFTFTSVHLALKKG